MRSVFPAILIAALVLTGCGRAPDPAVGRSAAETGGAGQAITSPPPLPSPSPETTPTPRPQDIQLRPKILSKKCFGSAGCNVTFSVRVTLHTVLPEDVEYLVTYEVTGGEDPLVNSMTIQGTSANVTAEEFITVPNARTKLRVKVIEIEAR